MIDPTGIKFKKAGETAPINRSFRKKSKCPIPEYWSVFYRFVFVRTALRGETQ